MYLAGSLCLACVLGIAEAGGGGLEVKAELSLTSAAVAVARKMATMNSILPDVLQPDAEKASIKGRAFIKVFRGEEVFEGYGSLVVGMDLKDYPEVLLNPTGRYGFFDRSREPPWFAFVEIEGRRHLPENTDSIQYWNIRGLPAKSHWSFRLVEGPIEAYGYFPGPMAACFAKAKPDRKAPPADEECLDVDQVRRYLWRHPRAYLEFDRDPVFAVKVFSTLSRRERSEKLQGDDYYYMQFATSRIPPLAALNDSLTRNPSDYLSLVARARARCEAGSHSEGMDDVGAAKSMDSSYYQLHWSEGVCLEKMGDSAMAAFKFREALRFSPLNPEIRMEIGNRIRKLGKTPIGTGEGSRTPRRGRKE